MVPLNHEVRLMLQASAGTDPASDSIRHELCQGLLSEITELEMQRDELEPQLKKASSLPLT